MAIDQQSACQRGVYFTAEQRAGLRRCREPVGGGRPGFSIRAGRLGQREMLTRLPAPARSVLVLCDGENDGKRRKEGRRGADGSAGGEGGHTAASPRPRDGRRQTSGDVLNRTGRRRSGRTIGRPCVVVLRRRPRPFIGAPRRRDVVVVVAIDATPGNVSPARSPRCC